jgi:DNA-binding GntR family transcriptional regulator
MSVDRGSVVPPWRQLAAILRERIESGEFPPGSRIPSIVSLSQEYQLAGITVRKALAALKEEGILETASGWGTYVAKDRPG